MNHLEILEVQFCINTSESEDAQTMCACVNIDIR